MARKTFDVNKFTAKVNAMLRATTCSAAERWAMAAVLESVLHDTGNYHGFRYLDAQFNDAGECVAGDVSRRHYYESR